MDNESRSVERRRHKRVQVANEAFFVVSPHCAGLGEVVDISKGGIAFCYVADTEWSGELFERGVLFGDNDFFLEDVPLKTISDSVVENGAIAGARKVRQRAVQFGELSERQRILLEQLISNSSGGEA